MPICILMRLQLLFEEVDELYTDHQIENVLLEIGWNKKKLTIHASEQNAMLRGEWLEMIRGVWEGSIILLSTSSFDIFLIKLDSHIKLPR